MYAKTGNTPEYSCCEVSVTKAPPLNNSPTKEAADHKCNEEGERVWNLIKCEVKSLVPDVRVTNLPASDFFLKDSFQLCLEQRCVTTRRHHGEDEEKGAPATPVIDLFPPNPAGWSWSAFLTGCHLKHAWRGQLDLRDWSTLRTVSRLFTPGDSTNVKTSHVT